MTYLDFIDQARAIIDEIKAQYPDCESARACFEQAPAFDMEHSRDMLQALAQYAPPAIQAISGTQKGTALDTLASQQATAPGYAALQNQITRDYGPEANRLGNELNRQTQLASAQTESDLLAGPGQALIGQALEAQKKLDPEYYKTRGLLSDSINKYLTGYDPYKLSGSELEQINRGISARQGPATPSQLQTIQNAQTFGNAGTQRWQNFGNALMQASSALPGFKGGLTGFEIGTKRPLISNQGEARLSSPVAVDPTQALNANFGFANNALNQIGAEQRSINSLFKSTDQRVNEGVQALGALLGGAGGV